MPRPYGAFRSCAKIPLEFLKNKTGCPCSARRAEARPGYLFHDLEHHRLSGPGSRSIQKISHGCDRVPVTADHFSNISFTHLHFEDHFAALLHFAHEHFFGSVDKLADNVLEKTLHWIYGVGTVVEFFFRAFRIMLATVAVG